MTHINTDIFTLPLPLFLMGFFMVCIKKYKKCYIYPFVRRPMALETEWSTGERADSTTGNEEANKISTFHRPADIEHPAGYPYLLSLLLASCLFPFIDSRKRGRDTRRRENVLWLCHLLQLTCKQWLIGAVLCLNYPVMDGTVMATPEDI